MPQGCVAVFVFSAKFGNNRSELWLCDGCSVQIWPFALVCNACLAVCLAVVVACKRVKTPRILGVIKWHIFASKHQPIVLLHTFSSVCIPTAFLAIRQLKD